MSTSPRRSQARLAYSGAFAVQSDFGSPLSDGAIDTLFNLVADSEPRIEFIDKSDEISDCTGQFTETEVLLSKSVRLSFDIEVTIAVAKGLLGWNFGTAVGADVLMLGVTEFQPAPTTFIYGHDDAAGTKLKLFDMVGDEIRFSAAVTERVRCSLVFRGNGSPLADPGYAFPDCSTILPVRLSDGKFLLNGVDRTDVLRQIEFQYSNALLADDDPFTAASPDITRMERADRRPILFNFTILGQPGDADHTAARDYTEMAVVWQIGADAFCVQIIATSAILKNGSGPGHSGQARRSTLGLSATPRKVSGDPQTPVYATLLD